MAPLKGQKRRAAVEVIDLTHSPPARSGHGRPTKVPRYHGQDIPVPSSSAVAQSQIGQPVRNEDYNNEEEDVEDSNLSQSFRDRGDHELYGTLNTKIVGCRFYHGYVTAGEMVLVRREPENAYDSNAIQILNVRGVQIGHISRDVAARLADLMDSKVLLIEGATTGRKDYYDCPIALNLYGSSNPIQKENTKAEMRNRRLPTDELRTREQMARQREREHEKKQKLLKMAQKGAIVGSGVGQGFNLQPGEFAASSFESLGSTTLEDIMRESERFNPRNADLMVEKFGLKEDDLKSMPMADQPMALKATLHPFQLQGLKWMLEKESPKIPPIGSNETVQLWKRQESNPKIITNIATNYSLENQDPILASGGILADDMGLGKTVQMISLILADRELKVPANRGASTATLIVAPLSVMSNWSSQIRRHTKEEHELRVCTYHGPKKLNLNNENIGDWDVVITTYDTIRSEYWSPMEQHRGEKGIFSVHWRRIVLDEGHNIRNPAAKTTTAICAFKSQSRWVLTGTPIINTLKDLFSLVRFLQVSGGIDRFELFNCAIIRPLNQGYESAGRILRSLMESICLRRKKDMKFINLKLPELSEYIHRIELLPHEREKYEALQAEAKGTLEEYQASHGRPGTNASQTYRHLLEVLLRLRQVCNHWKLCGENRFESLKDLDGKLILELTPQNRAALEQMLQISIEAQDDCPICLDTLNEPVITLCTHSFCFNCIEKVVETQHKCPLCRSQLDSTAKLIRPPKNDSTLVDIDPNESSSKIEALMSILKASRNGQGNKTIVFSQWTSFLDLLGPHLTKHEFNFVRIDGTMSAAERDAALDALENDSTVTVLLASLGVCSVGLNLVAANQVIMADSWWAPAIEDQAVDRVHRLGQKKPTKVFRLVVEGSVEEKVLDIQEDKRKLVMVALAESRGTRGGTEKRARLADIQKLLLM